jgi:hypothetical protein
LAELKGVPETWQLFAANPGRARVPNGSPRVNDTRAGAPGGVRDLAD